jgi:hypothetical protein
VTFRNAIIKARDERCWIRSVEEGKRHPIRWIKLTPDGSLSYVFTDRTRVEQRGYIPPVMGDIERYLGAWETTPDPYPPQKAPGASTPRFTAPLSPDPFDDPV